VAATFPGIGAVVCLAGSGYVTQGISQSVYTGSLREIMTTLVASWTYQGHGRTVPGWHVPMRSGRRLGRIQRHELRISKMLR
jgi:hypothetical protein